MNSIEKEAAKAWNKNLKDKLEENGFSQASFANAFKQAYPDESCTQGKVSRWMNVGGQSSQAQEIGYPKYENMKKIAALLGVSVGYLIGETSYESYDMEKACKYLGISKSTGAAIRALTFGTGHWSDRIMGKDYAEVMSYLFTTPGFKEFIHELQPVFLAKWICQLQLNDIDTLKQAIQEIRPEVLDVAMECRSYPFGEVPENAPEATDEVMSAIELLRKLEDAKGRLNRTDSNLRAAKYTLFEKYSKMIEESLCSENISSWNLRRQKTTPVQEELMNLFDITDS